MIDALFGSKTRVKLLYLFLNNPGQKFYVREITRKIEEQINSVRRELSNMITVGVVTSSSSDNKLYYQVNQKYDHYVALRAIFANIPVDKATESHIKKIVAKSKLDYKDMFKAVSGVRVAIASGILIEGSTSPVDLIVAGNVSALKVGNVVKEIERNENREINYTILPYDELYYRLSIRDKFITQIINNKHEVIIDTDGILSSN